MENAATKRFGRYQVVGELGRGAMGVVYKAHDPQIERMVAVKTVSLWEQEHEAEKEFRLRFINEAQAAGRLHHAGIVSVFDVGEKSEDQEPYIVLEYVAGESLNRILAREKKLPLPKALRLAEEIAEALDYAHKQGVVHRDIKPANILVTEDGHAKIADFGIAKLNLAHFTLPGKVLGTPAYMAPEQLTGEGADGRSDLFSLGVILYVMVTGHSPFPGNSATTVCFKVATREPVAASAFDLSLPPQLDAVISQAITKDPAERYQSGAEFAEDLRLLQQGFKAGSTTTSMRTFVPSAARSLRNPSATGSGVAPAVSVAHARDIGQRILMKAPIRDLMLAGLTIVLLVVIGAQSKLLTTPSKTTLNSASTASSSSKSAAIPVTSRAQPVLVPTIPIRGDAVATRIKTRTARVPMPASETVVPSSTLELSVQHQFKDATLYVWIDGKLAVTHALHGGAQKKLVLFNGIHGAESETLEVPAGNHILRVRALSADQSVDLSRTVSTQFIGGDDKALQVIIEKHNTMMRLLWQ